MEERFFEVTKVVDLKKRYPALPVEHIMELIKGLMFNGDANVRVIDVKGESKHIGHRYEFTGDATTPLKGDTEAAAGAQLNPKTGRFTTIKNFNKRFELIGALAGGAHGAVKFTQNPFGLKPGYFGRCERCGLVGIVGVAVHYKRKPPNKMTYVYKNWKHEAGDGHYVGVARYHDILSWEEVCKREKKEK